MELKIKNRGKNFFSWGKKSDTYTFSMKIEMVDL